MGSNIMQHSLEVSSEEQFLWDQAGLALFNKGYHVRPSTHPRFSLVMAFVTQPTPSIRIVQLNNVEVLCARSMGVIEYMERLDESLHQFYPITLSKLAVSDFVSGDVRGYAWDIIHAINRNNAGALNEDTYLSLVFPRLVNKLVTEDSKERNCLPPDLDKVLKRFNRQQILKKGTEKIGGYRHRALLIACLTKIDQFKYGLFSSDKSIFIYTVHVQLHKLISETEKEVVEKLKTSILNRVKKVEDKLVESTSS